MARHKRLRDLWKTEGQRMTRNEKDLIKFNIIMSV